MRLETGERSVKVADSAFNCLHIGCVSKRINLDDEAIAALEAYRQSGESFSSVVKRLALPPIETFGDLEAFVEQLEGPLLSDLETLRKIRPRRPD